MVKSVTAQAAGQTTGGIPRQNVFSAYQTTSLQGLHPGALPMSTQPQPNAPTQATAGTLAGDPVKIHPDGIIGGLLGAVVGGVAGAVLGSKLQDKLEPPLTKE